MQDDVCIISDDEYDYPAAKKSKTDCFEYDQRSPSSIPMSAEEIESEKIILSRRYEHQKGRLKLLERVIEKRLQKQKQKALGYVNESNGLHSSVQDMFTKLGYSPEDLDGQSYRSLLDHIEIYLDMVNDTCIEPIRTLVGFSDSKK